MTKDQHIEALITKYDLLYESRLSKTEATMEMLMETCREIKSDLRWMLGIGITYGCIILGLLAKGFHWVQ